MAFDTKKYFTKKLGNLYNRDQCFCESNLKKNETCFKAKNWLKSYYDEKEWDSLRKTYENIIISPLEEERCIKQITKDLPRTFPKNKYFSENSEGFLKLKKILVSFSKYEPNIGYVQGMNFIAGSLLYHSEEYIAFWLLVMIFEKFELRDIYLPCLKLPFLLFFLMLFIYKLYQDCQNIAK